MSDACRRRAVTLDRNGDRAHHADNVVEARIHSLTGFMLPLRAVRAATPHYGAYQAGGSGLFQRLEQKENKPLEVDGPAP